MFFLVDLEMKEVKKNEKKKRNNDISNRLRTLNTNPQLLGMLCFWDGEKKSLEVLKVLKKEMLQGRPLAFPWKDVTAMDGEILVLCVY